MTGHNKLVLNQATMQEAMAYWLSSKFVTGTKFKIENVTEIKADNTFIVLLEAPPAEEAA